MTEPAKTPLQQEEKPPLLHYDTRLPKLTFLQRLLIPIIAWVVWAVIRILGPTIRFEVLGGQWAGRDYRPDLPPNVYAFWHRCIIAATWYFRNRDAVLMNTTNFDGQWTRRVIERLGYQTAQGSSTRGGLRGLAVMAKRLEEVWVPSEPDPIILPRNSEGLYLLQRVRDEAHRFAINYHRSKRSKRMTASALDAVPGLGEHRRKALVAHFGSLARLREATVDEITSVPGIGVATATAVLDALRGGAAGSDAATQDRIAERASG